MELNLVSPAADGNKTETHGQTLCRETLKHTLLNRMFPFSLASQSSGNPVEEQAGRV